jgi:hypothetical protein
VTHPERQTLDPQGTRHSGLSGLFEATLRRFKLATRIIVLLPLYAFAGTLLGTAAAPGVSLFTYALEHTQGWGIVPRAFVLGPAAGVAYYAYGFTLIALVPLVNFAFRLRLKAWRGAYNSFEVLPWFLHNGLTYLARYTFLEMITPTPFSILFYRGMGMKIGRNVELNSTHLSDPSLITIGDKVTIGGSAVVVGHYAAGGFLVLAPVIIEEGATVGLQAVVMGGVHIGKKARVLPNSFVAPKTRIPDGETWGGIPARPVAVAQPERAA